MSTKIISGNWRNVVGTPVFAAEAEAGPVVGPAEQNRWTLPGRMWGSDRALDGVSRTHLFAGEHT